MTKRPPTEVRKPRADAQRNRARLVEAARAVFLQRGGAASMEEIGKAAGVGAGTLYRHFPRREDLLAAVYLAEVEKLAEAQRRLSAEKPPGEALRTWLLLFLEYLAAKRVIGALLQEGQGAACGVFQQTQRVLEEASAELGRRAVEAGELRAEVAPLDLLRALFGVAGSTPDSAMRAQPFVDVLLRGARP